MDDIQFIDSVYTSSSGWHLPIPLSSTDDIRNALTLWQYEISAIINLMGAEPSLSRGNSHIYKRLVKHANQDISTLDRESLLLFAGRLESICDMVAHIWFNL